MGDRKGDLRISSDREGQDKRDFEESAYPLGATEVNDDSRLCDWHDDLLPVHCADGIQIETGGDLASEGAVGRRVADHVAVAILRDFVSW